MPFDSFMTSSLAYELSQKLTGLKVDKVCQPERDEIVVNRSYGVWDYRDMPLNYRGQICLPFFAAWMPLGVFAMWLYGKVEKKLK